MSKVYKQINSIAGANAAVFGGGGGSKRKRSSRKKTTEIKSQAVSRQHRDYENAMRSAGWGYVKDYSRRA